MAEKKILVTGSNGLLGQKIVYKLRNRPDVKLIATARGDNRLVEKSSYTYESMDITDKKSVDKVIDKYQPDSIIHCAAMTNVDACETDRENCVKSNIDAVKFIVEACERHDIHLVHISTDFIFDGKAGPYKEEDKPHPLSYYGWSKLKGEKIVRASKLRWAILRTVLVFGIVDNMSRSNIVFWVKGSLEKGRPINVVDDQFRTPTLAEDLADGCISASLKEAEGIFNVSGKDYMSIYELVQKVADFYHLDKSLINRVSSDKLNQPAKRPPKTGFVLTKAMKELDYRPHSFRESLEILDAQLKN